MRKSTMRRHSRRMYCAPCFENLERRSLLSLTTLDFEDLPTQTVITHQYQSEGADFHLRDAISLRSDQVIYPDRYPPHSGVSFIVNNGSRDNPGSSIRIDAYQGVWTTVGGYVTGDVNVVMTAYDSYNNVLGRSETGGRNWVGSGSSLPPNLKLEIDNLNIAYVIFDPQTEPGHSGFALDDFFFDFGGADIVKASGPDSKFIPPGIKTDGLTYTPVKNIPLYQDTPDVTIDSPGGNGVTITPGSNLYTGYIDVTGQVTDVIARAMDDPNGNRPTVTVNGQSATVTYQGRAGASKVVRLPA